LEKRILNKILLALFFSLFLAACGDEALNGNADAESLPSLTEEAESLPPSNEIAGVEYPTCNPQADDAETSCPMCYGSDDDAIASAPPEEQIVCDTSLN
jgi:hypothetical protein